MRLSRRKFFHLAAGAAFSPAASSIAVAQTYPTRPVRIIVGFAAGGAPDILFSDNGFRSDLVNLSSLRTEQAQAAI